MWLVIAGYMMYSLVLCGASSELLVSSCSSAYWGPQCIAYLFFLSIPWLPTFALLFACLIAFAFAFIHPYYSRFNFHTYAFSMIRSRISFRYLSSSPSMHMIQLSPLVCFNINTHRSVSASFSPLSFLFGSSSATLRLDILALRSVWSAFPSQVTQRSPRTDILRIYMNIHEQITSTNERTCHAFRLLSLTPTYIYLFGCQHHLDFIPTPSHLHSSGFYAP